MAGAVGCFVSLIIVGSMIAAFGGRFGEYPMAGHVAIGEFGGACHPAADSLSLCLHLRCKLQLQLGSYR